MRRFCGEGSTAKVPPNLPREVSTILPRRSQTAVDDFYRSFTDGRYYAAFGMELDAAIKHGRLQ